MIFTVYNDIHKFAPHEIKVDFIYGENVIYNGDIVDLGACKYSKLPEANAFLYDLIEKCQGNFVSGNHEKMMDYKSVVKNGVLFTHGDLIFKDIKKARDFRWGREGSGWFRRFYIRLGSIFRSFLKKNHMISESEMREAIRWAKKHNCHTVVCGHKHPKKELFKEKDGIKLYILKRGRNTITI